MIIVLILVIGLTCYFLSEIKMSIEEIILDLEFILSEPDDMMREYLEQLIQEIQFN